MSMDESETVGESSNKFQLEQIEAIIKLMIANNENIPFKNQQRSEIDLSDTEKFTIALNLYKKNRVLFLTRFGKFLTNQQLDIVNSILDETSNEEEATLVINNLRTAISKSTSGKSIKNRRYEALKRLIAENSYFSESEMKRRNPLLYEQLIGQYLTKEEVKLRNRNDTVAANSLVTILLDGIDRELSDKVKQEQLIYMDTDEKDSSDEESAISSENCLEIPEQEIRKVNQPRQLWGEFSNEQVEVLSTTHFQRRVVKIAQHKPNTEVTWEEKRFLRDEFISAMYESFLTGKDEYDYTLIDYDEQYDNLEMIDHDEEDKYFDSEEPDEEIAIEQHIDGIKTNKEESSSEDELDMFMSSLNNHPTICQLTTEMKKL